MSDTWWVQLRVEIIGRIERISTNTFLDIDLISKINGRQRAASK